MKTIKVSDELHEFLTKQAVGKNESYDQIIKRLLNQLWQIQLGQKEPENV